MSGEDHLRRAISGSDRSSTTRTNSSFGGIARTLSSGVASFLGSLTSKFSKTSFGELPLHTQRSIGTPANSEQEQPQIPLTANGEKIYLLLCYNEGRWAIKLLQLDLVELQSKSDTDLFNLLCTQYNQMRGGFLASLSLCTLTNIKFVYFNAHRNDLVEVQKQDDIPPPENPEYRYDPVPPELIPPVGERYMVRSHVFSAHSKPFP